VLSPGFGISNIVEIGMTPEIVATKVNDFSLKKINAGSTCWNARAPSLGAFWEQSEKEMPVTKISFVVSSSYLHASPDLAGLSRFCGDVAGGISFAKDGCVTREDITRCYGEPKHVFGENCTTAQETITLKQRWLEMGESYIYRIPTNSISEVLNYPGVSFTLHSNRAVTVHIYAKFR
jgi:hypothetical protein